MSTWWMPRRFGPTKDVATRRNAQGRGWHPVILRSPNGATPLGNTSDPACREGTGGTETSHVPRGKERIPVVAASEPGGAQTIWAVQTAVDAWMGLNARQGGPGRGLA